MIESGYFADDFIADSAQVCFGMVRAMQYEFESGSHGEDGVAYGGWWHGDGGYGRWIVCCE